MSVTVDSLEVQIQSDSTSAVNGIDALSASLTRLKSALSGGIGLTSVANQLSKVSTAAQGASSTAANLDKLATSLQKLSTLGSIKISSTIAKNITSIGTAVKGLDTVDTTKLESISKTLSTIPKISLGSFNANSITKLATALNTLDADGLAEKFDKLNTSVAPLATNLNSVTTSLKQMAPAMTRVQSATSKVSSSNGRANSTYVDFYAKLRTVIGALRVAGNTVAGWINESNSYIEDVNLFTASMGEYAAEAQQYAEQVGELMGIDPGEFMRNEGVFNTIIKGFGVASDKAYLMSKNLTQLGYDISSFYNISVEDAMTKLTSGISGELEPLRRLGYDLSYARLQQDAYNLGIEKNVQDMTQAEKSQLRYYEIMTQVTVAQGDMARTLNAPANQLRVLQAQVTLCARSLGDVFIPVLNAVLPYAIAFAKALRVIATEIANFFGFELPEVDYSSLNSNLSRMSDDLSQGSDAVGDLADGADDTASGLGDAAKNAKELTKYLLKFDELNVIPSQNDSSSSGSSKSGKASSGSSGIGGAGLGSDLGIDLPQYDFLQGLVDSKANQVFEKLKGHLKDILSYLVAIGAAIGAWKISKNVLDFIQMLKDFKGFTAVGNISGLLMLFGDIVKLKRYIKDIADNGVNFYNAAGVISSFAGMVGDAFTMMGNYKLGGTLKLVQGVGEIIAAIADWKINGFSSNTALTALEGVGDIITAIGILKQNWLMVGTGIAFTGLLGIIRQLGDVIDAIKTGDWSGVDVIALVVNAVQLIGGLIIAFMAFHGKFQKMPTSVGDEMKKTAETVDTVGDVGETLSNSTSSMSGKLKDLAGNLGWGILIIGEVAAAAIIMVGTIALLGFELQAVGTAWQPVIENGPTVATAILAGAGLLASIGVVTALIGKYGGVNVAANIAVGTAILVEVSAATDLFVGEIIILGWMLGKVVDTWTPVNDNKDLIVNAIETGTLMLTAVGLATAALGGITIASAGTLPIAIGIGTLLLMETSAAAESFVDEVADLAEQLSDRLAPALDDLNGKLPGLSWNMDNFTFFMSQFAGEVVSYSANTTISGFASTVAKIIGFFNDDPIESMTNEVEKVGNQIRPLNDKLNEVNPDLQLAYDLLTDYQNYLSRLEDICGQGGDHSELALNTAINMKDVGTKLVAGLVEGIQSKAGDLDKAGSDMIAELQKGWESGNNNLLKSVSDTMSKLKDTIGTPSTWSTGKGSNMISGMQNGWNSGKNSFANSVSSTMNQSKSIIGTPSSWSTSRGRDMISGMRNGFNSGRSNFSNSVSGAMDDSKRKIGTPSVWTRDKGEDMITGLRQGFNATSGDFINLVGGLRGRIFSALGDMWSIGHSAIVSFVNGLTSIHIPSPNFDWNWRKVGPVSIPTFSVHWNAAGGLFTSPAVLQGFGEAGDEAAIPLTNKWAMKRIASAIADNGGVAASDNDSDLEEVITRAVANVMQTYSNSGETVVYAELKTENDETLARAVARGQKRLDYRMNPVGVTG